MNRQEFFDRVTTPNPTYKRALTEFAEALQDLQVKADRDLPIQLQATEPDPHYFDGVVDRVSQTASTVAQLLQQPELKGKKIVAVGGAFSAGKSSLINALIGEKRLVAEVDPTTSVPTYVCAGPSERITAINLFQQQIELSAAEFASLTHDEHSQHGSQIGGLLRSVTVQTPNFAWPHLALLDTPGYSKPGEAASSERTDAEIARDQLNAADYILWVVSAAAGAMSADELEFLRSLKPEIPKLLVISRADSKPAEDIAAIQALMAETLKRHQIEVVDVVVTSARKPQQFPLDGLHASLGQWNVTKVAPDQVTDLAQQLEGLVHQLYKQVRCGGYEQEQIKQILSKESSKDFVKISDLGDNQWETINTVMQGLERHQSQSILKKLAEYKDIAFKQAAEAERERQAQMQRDIEALERLKQEAEALKRRAEVELEREKDRRREEEERLWRQEQQEYERSKREYEEEMRRYKREERIATAEMLVEDAVNSFKRLFGKGRW